MIINTYVNYGGRNSRLCYLVPLLVHTLFLYLVYLIYFNIEIINIYILLIFIIFINLEWPLVIIYEYIYLTNYVIQNNLLYNIALVIFLEILLFVGFYWLYINNIIHPVSNMNYNYNNAFTYINNIDNNTDICLYIILHNLLLLLYVTLVLQFIHKDVMLVNSTNVNNNNNVHINGISSSSFLSCNIYYIILYYIHLVL